MNVRSWERAAAYVPDGVREGRRVAAPDEDGFTMAATALERLEPTDADSPPPTAILIVGDLPPSADADLVRFSGFPIRTERFGRGATALRSALASATEPSRSHEPIWLVAVDLLASVDAENPPAGGVSDGAVALRIGPGETSGRPIAVSDLPAESRGSAAPLLAVGRSRIASDPADWTGDFMPRPERMLPMSLRPRSAPPREAPVSQGAYVPRPRYLENLSSRWRLVGERCGACGRVGYPPRGRCRACGSADGLRPVRLPRDGAEVVATTTIGPGGQPTEFDEQVAVEGPYEVVLADLAPGARATFQVTDARAGEVVIGSRVGTRLRRLYPMEGEWRYGRKAVPQR